MMTRIRLLTIVASTVHHLFAFRHIVDELSALDVGVKELNEHLANSTDAQEDVTKQGAGTGVGMITAMQWSAHWKCFHPAFFGPTCAPKVKELLGKWLVDANLDFVNLGMFQDPAWRPPARFGFFDYKCSTDNIKVLYDKTKWRISTYMKLPKGYTNEESQGENEVKTYTEPSAKNIFGCSNKNGDGSADRVYGVFPFKGVANENEKVIVVTGHFPHPPGGTSSAETSVADATADVIKDHMAPKIAYIRSKTSWKDAKVVFIGDLNNNENGNRPEEFDNVAAIESAFKVMEQAKHVNAVKGMKGQIRDATDKGFPEGFQGEFPGLGIGCTRSADGKTVCDKTVEEALAMPNRGWVDQPIMSSEQVWAAFKDVPLRSATDPIGTCCADKPALVGDKVAFPYTFDRIMASFGPLVTIMPLGGMTIDSALEDIQKLFVGAFHMPIIAKIGTDK
jgi:hypothetical protein